MKPIDYVKHIAEVMPEDALIVASHTDNTSALMSLNITKKSFLGWNMGFATPVGLGLALALPHRKVIILEGDGGVLLLSAAVSDLAAQRPANVIVVVNDNESTLGFPTYTAGDADLAAMAQAAGIKRARTVRDHEEFKAEFDEALAMNELTYIVAKTDAGRVPVPETARRPFLWENKFEFVRYIEETEGVSILRPIGRMG